MKKAIDRVLTAIGEEYANRIQKGARNYLEVSIGKQAERLGYSKLADRYRYAFAVVPLKGPQAGMKVRIDGRTFVNYAEDASGIAVPGYLARETGRKFRTFVPQDSMICNFT